MKINEFLKIYTEDSFIQILTTYLDQRHKSMRLSGLIGSLDAVVAGAVYQIRKDDLLNDEKNNTKYALDNYVFIMHDREEAYYFQNDLQNLLPDENILFFPASYKRPYQFEEIENASVLQRGEVLNAINQTISKNNKDFIVVTYPEALAEKVVNKRSLVENTFVIKLGEKLGMDFILEILNSYAFERADFVYEAGQYAVRGGIIDIFSYSTEYPYRIEFWGEEIDSIRSFDPLTQLSVNILNFATLIPNIHTRLTQATREGFLEFLPDNTVLWCKDLQGLLDYTERYFEKVETYFENITPQNEEATLGVHLLTNPSILFETKENIETQLQNFSKIEFGKRFLYPHSQKVEVSASTQPIFNKNFTLLSENLQRSQHENYTNCIASDSIKQMNRLEQIFEEINPTLSFEVLPIALRDGFIDHQRKIVCYTDHQIFERYHRYQAREKYSKSKAITLKELKSLQAGDYVTHIEHGIGRFAGMEKKEVEGVMQEMVRLVYKNNDLLFVNIHSLHKISKHSGKDGVAPNISKLGSPEWENKKSKVKKQLQDIAEDLIKLYAKRKAKLGYSFSIDSYLQLALESSFLYQETPDQTKAIQDTKTDMEKPYPMDRLVCGDVGFGKTEVAIRAAFKAVCDSKQVAVLVPTTILAMQHFRTFSERLSNLPCKVACISRFTSAKDVKETLIQLASGELDIIIGTQKLVSEKVKFKDLGLLIIDEEQKFGVKTKDKLKEIKPNVDILTLTATPIPRTLHFSLLGARDLSIIATPPPNRQPVSTEVHSFNEEIIRDAISYELKRGGQVFFVHNRLSDIDTIGNIILKLVPEARIGIAHGQMEGSRLEKIMMKFIDGDYDILVSTNIIESGLDIPNANTIIINNAQMFGMSDLHQMRGRVGRSNKKAFCYLLAPAAILLTADTRKRLQALEEFSDLGDGFKVAMRDLDMRGAGNMLGSEQSGFINDLGFETYHKILDEAVRELKENEFKELFASEFDPNEIHNDCNIETDLPVIIPESYIRNLTERLTIYTQLDDITHEEELQKFQSDLKDRFGELPKELLTLTEIVRLRWLAEKIGFSRLLLKNNQIRGYFIEKQNYFTSDRFKKVVNYMQKHPKLGNFKEIQKKPMLALNHITNIAQAKKIFEEMIQ